MPDEYEESTDTEVRVVYFPPDRPTVKRKVADIGAAMRLCKDVAEFAPLIEQRTITSTPWEVVRAPGTVCADA